jgi:hypothetical protein
MFRVCGGDDRGGDASICAQTLQFITGAPVQDSAVGSWTKSPSFTGSVNAHSGPAGQSPQGTLSARQSFDTFTGNVTCLRVVGNTATVGGVGHAFDSPDAKETLLVTIVDGGLSANDTVALSFTPGSTTPPSCAGALPGGTDTGSTGVVVNNAP